MKAKFQQIVVLVFSFLFVLSLSGAAHADPEGNAIKMGVITTLTGPAGVYGLSTQCSLNSLAQLINDKGGITVKGKKYTIRLIYADDKLTVAGARAAAEKLLYTDKVDFIVGAFSQQMVSAWAPLAMKEKKITLVGGPGVEPRPEWPYLFHVSSTESSRSFALCKIVKEKLGAKSVLYVFSDSQEGRRSKQIAEFQEKMRGLEVKDYIFTSNFTKDFYPLLTQALKTNPDFMFINLVPGAAALFIKQARELGFKGILGNSNNMPSDLNKWQRIAGIEASKGFIAIAGLAAPRTMLGEENSKYFAKNCPNYKATDIAYVLQPHILLRAIEKAQSFDPDVLRKTLQTESFVTLITKPIKAGGEKTYGIKQHMDVPVPYSMVAGPDELEFLGSIPYITP